MKPQQIALSDCHFYHCIDLPDSTFIPGDWDLRNSVDTYLGGYDFAGKRVLEIGPASGFLTTAMEKRGASVLAVEVTDDPGWDFVPYPETVLGPERAPRAEIMRKLKNSWWFVHEQLSSKAEIYYGNSTDLPDTLGQFNVAVLAAILTHCRSPAAIMESCAKRSDAIIVVESYKSDLEGRPLCLLNPTAQSKDWGTWWYFSTQFFTQFLEVMGYTVSAPTLHDQLCHGVKVPMFTIIGRR